MKPLHQLYRHDPENGVFGDCHRTAIACLLDMNPANVPHFYEIAHKRKLAGQDRDWREDVEEFLNLHGYTQVDVLFGGDLEGLFAYMQDRNPGQYYLLGGKSERGLPHTVICCGGRFEHDPHPANMFLQKPFEHGYWEVTYLLPLSMKRVRR